MIQGSLSVKRYKTKGRRRIIVYLTPWPPLQSVLLNTIEKSHDWRGGNIYERGWRPSPQATPLFGDGKY
jgi:hypothetical protein